MKLRLQTFLIILGISFFARLGSAQIGGIAAAFAAFGAANNSAPAQAVQPPWMAWQRNPLTLPLSLNVTNIDGDTNGAILVTLSDATVSQFGAGTNGPTNAFSVANMKPRCQYTLTVQSTNINGAYLGLAWTANWTPLTRTGRQGKPKTYHLLIDGVDQGAFGYALTAGSIGGSYSNSYTLELTENLPVNWRQEDGSDDPSFAPGDGAWAQIGPGKSSFPSQGGISWSVSLGRLMDGLAAGRLTLREPCITSNIFTPTNLFYTAGSQTVRDQVTLITETQASPVLRQIQANQTFVDIINLTNSTEMRFYQTNQIGAGTNAAGWYTNISGSPFVVWSLVNPAAPDTNQLNIIEARNGLNRTNHIEFASGSNTWILTYGTGAEKKIETRHITVSTSGGNTNRIEVDDIRYAGASTPAYQMTETYHLFPWGYELTQTDIPVGSSNLTTVMAYYTDSGDLSTFKQLESTVYPDGNWEKRLYDDGEFYGALLYVLHPIGDSPADPSTATLDNTLYDYYVNPNGYKYTQWTDSRLTGDIQTAVVRKRHDTAVPTAGLIENDNLEQYEHRPVFVGDRKRTFDDSWDFGLFQHPTYEENSKDAIRSSYYHGGTYDAGSHSFTTSTNDVWVGPDWRQSTVFWGVNEYGDSDEPTLAPSGSYVYYAENQTLYNTPSAGIYLMPFQNWKETSIYSGGSLVQKEKYVVTAIDPDNETNQVTFDLIGKWVYQNDSLGHVTNITWIDGASGVTRTTYSADYKGGQTFDGDLKLWEQNEQGIRTNYVYDSLKRVVATVKEGVAASGSFAAQAPITNGCILDAKDRCLVATMSSTGLSMISSNSYDLNGRPLVQMDTNGLITSFVYDAGGRVITETMPSGTTKITENHLDRRTKSITGTGVVNEFHYWDNYGIPRISAFPFHDDPTDDSSIDVGHIIHYGTTNSPRYKQEGLDNLGRTLAVITPDGNGTNTMEIDYVNDFFNHPLLIGQEYNAAMPHYMHTHFDFAGRTNGTMMGPIHDTRRSSSNRLAYTFHAFEKNSGAWFDVETNVIYRSYYSYEPTMSSIRKTRLNGFSSGGNESEITIYDADTNANVVTTVIDRSIKMRLTQVSDSRSTLGGTNYEINGLLLAENSVTVSSPVLLSYDSLGRMISIKNPLGFANYKTFNTRGQLLTETDFNGIVTMYKYYDNGVNGAGQLSTITTAGKTTRYAYSSLGKQYRLWGDVPFPAQMLYNLYGDLTNLQTFRSGTDWNGSNWPATPGGGDSTSWSYHEGSGLATEKMDAAGHSITYSFSQGRQTTRTLARGVTVTNLYNDFNEIIAYTYSDGTTPVLRTNIDRAGDVGVIIDAAGTNSFSYDYAQRLVYCIYTGGLMSGITLSNHFNTVNGRDALVLGGLSMPITNTFHWDVFGRLSVVSNGLFAAEYSYANKSDLLENTLCKSNGVTLLGSGRTWDYGLRLREIKNTIGGAIVDSHSFGYDSVGRRSVQVLEDGSYWQYEYDDRNELINAKRSWIDRTMVSGQQFGYAYDNIGNRVSTTFGGDAFGGSLRSISYTNNNLNQYIGVARPGVSEIAGIAIATNSVSINSVSADRKGEYFHGEVYDTNVSGAAWQNVSIISGAASTSGGLITPPHSQTLAYDLDGNWTYDGIWNYKWDAENRLVSMNMTNVVGVASSNRLRLDFVYDYMGRRVQKMISVWNGSGFSNSDTNIFVYDGWNVLAVCKGRTNAIKAFTWGRDLSGSIDGAKGIGGLLMVTTYEGATTNSFVTYDGNGNIVALVDAGTANINARYEYSPFGELLRATGPSAESNPFRFATRFFDTESSLTYYGHRYYSPNFGRWISRDSAGETGGNNLYHFNFNQPITRMDLLGDASAKDVDFGGGWSGNVQTFDTSGEASFEVHVYNPQGGEVGVIGPEGWIAKHGFEGPPAGIPEDIYRMIKSEAVQVGRRAGVFPEKGFGNIKNFLWNSTSGVVRNGGKIAGVLVAAAAINAALESGLHAAETAQSYAKNAKAGNIAEADLDAIDIAIDVQNATGNYFFTYEALDILLQ